MSKFTPDMVRQIRDGILRASIDPPVARTDALLLVEAVARLSVERERHEAVVKAARLLLRRDTFDMRIVQVREDNLRDQIHALDAVLTPQAEAEGKGR